MDGNGPLRPFVCEGDPTACRIFIVGTNPATTIGRCFWEFWEAGYGFRKEIWLNEYQSARAARRAAGERIHLVSPTRKRIEWIVEAAKPWSCLETNVYAKPTRSEREMRVRDRTNAILDFLIAEIKPAVVIAHGRAAHEYVVSSKVPLVLRVPHLFNMAKAEAVRCGAKAKEALEDIE